MIKSKPTIVHRLSITKARVNLSAVLRRVYVNKEYFIIEKNGIPVAGIMDADELEDYLELRDPRVRKHIRKSNEDFLAGKSRPAHELLHELQRMTQERTRPLKK